MNGYIFAIGGGNNIDINIFKEMLKKSKNNNVLLITDASTYAFTNHSGKASKSFNQFNNININKRKLNNIKNLNELNELLDHHGIIYFTGGFQSYLGNKINHFNKKNKIDIRKYLIKYLKNGGIIGGTSAGASILGKYMPNGMVSGFRNNRLYLGNMPLDNKVYSIEKGLNILPFIIDQHFSEKKRHSRGINMAVDNRMPLLGIDENTAIYIQYGSNIVNKIGPNSVTLYDGSKIKFRKNRDFIQIHGFNKYKML